MEEGKYWGVRGKGCEFYPAAGQHRKADGRGKKAGIFLGRALKLVWVIGKGVGSTKLAVAASSRGGCFARVKASVRFGQAVCSSVSEGEERFFVFSFDVLGSASTFGPHIAT